VTRRLLEQLLVCRPADSISFSVRFYSDERTPNPAVSHALHSLMFLLRKPKEFRAALSCVYCSVLLEGGGGRSSHARLDKGKDKDTDKKGAPGAKADKDKDAAEGKDAAADSEAGGAGGGGAAADAFDTAAGAEAGAAAKSGADLLQVASGTRSCSSSESVLSDKEATLKAIFGICRAAVRAATRVQPGQGAPTDASSSDSDTSSKPDWVCTAIENSMTDTLSSSAGNADAPPTDFEACVAFVRTYLCLRVVAASAVRILAKRVGELELLGGALEAFTSKMVVEEDVALIEQILTTSTAKHGQNHQKVITGAMSQYLQLLTREK